MNRYEKQFAKKFSKDCLSDRSVEVQLNMFLHDYTNFEIKTTNYWNNPRNCEERLLVVFLAHRREEDE